MPSVDRDNLLTAAELAERLGVKPGTVLGWYRKGRIPARKLSHKVLRFDLADVLSALETPPKPHPEAPGNQPLRRQGKEGREIPVGEQGQDIQHLVNRVDELVNRMIDNG